MAEDQPDPKEAMRLRRGRFVAEYLKDMNGKQAAIRAGYSPKSAEVQASILLSKPKVAAAVAKAQAARSRRTAITQDRVLEELSLLAFSNVSNYVMDDFGHIALAEGAPKRAMRAVSSIKRKVTTRASEDGPVTTYETELKLWDKPGPLKLAGRHVGLFNEQQEAAPPAIINLYTGMKPPPELASDAQDSTLKKEGE